MYFVVEKIQLLGLNFVNPVLKTLGNPVVLPQIKCITALYFASFSKQQQKIPQKNLNSYLWKTLNC